MSSTQHFSIATKVSVLVVGVGFLIVCGVWYAKRLRVPETVSLREIGNKHEVPFDPDPDHLNTLPAPEAIRSRLLNGDFTMAYRMQDISEDCLASLNSSFLNHSGTMPKKGEIDFADPGQPAQYGDSLIPNAPFRQLIMAGRSPKTCFLYYRHGGENHPSYCLAAMDQQNRKTIWVGEAREEAKSLDQLRSFLSGNKFDDSAGPVC